MRYIISRRFYISTQMKSTLTFIALIIAAALSSCSHNSGGDRSLWGTWKLESYYIGDIIADEYRGNYFFKFQADVVLVQEIDDTMHERIDHFGTYVLNEDLRRLTLYFNHHDQETSDGTGVYSPPAGIGINQQISIFDISFTAESKLELSYLSESGITYTYHLKRYF